MEEHVTVIRKMEEMMEQLEIKDGKDKLTVAGILVANGYTVRIVTVKDGNKNKSVLQYEKNNQRRKDE